jgi:anti-sigma regulatory factor (Ser/Thr protein kinase)
MSMLSALMRSLRHQYESPAALLIALDERLAESLRPGTFVTMFYGILDPRTGDLVFASAGHNPTVVYRASTGRMDRHPSKGIPLAAIRGGAIRRTLQDERVVLNPGDMLIQYTDGLNEAFRAGGEEQFGLDRLTEAAGAAARRGGTAVLEELRSKLDAWTGGGPRLDDETVLVVSRELTEAEAGSIDDDAPRAETTQDRDPLSLLADARYTGSYLPLNADLEGLEALRGWVRELPGVRDLATTAIEQVRAALYEAAANIVEHGYGNDHRKTFEIWYVQGHFVLVDHGMRFSADNWRKSDFSDPKVWRRGRGFGLDIIHSAMARVGYYPGTVEGNVTVLMFDQSALPDGTREVHHA